MKVTTEFFSMKFFFRIWHFLVQRNDNISLNVTQIEVLKVSLWIGHATINYVYIPFKMKQHWFGVKTDCLMIHNSFWTIIVSLLDLILAEISFRKKNKPYLTQYGKNKKHDKIKRLFFFFFFVNQGENKVPSLFFANIRCFYNQEFARLRQSTHCNCLHIWRKKQTKCLIFFCYCLQIHFFVQFGLL